MLTASPDSNVSGFPTRLPVPGLGFALSLRPNSLLPCFVSLHAWCFSIMDSTLWIALIYLNSITFSYFSLDLRRTSSWFIALSCCAYCFGNSCSWTYSSSIIIIFCQIRPDMKVIVRHFNQRLLAFPSSIETFWLNCQHDSFAYVLLVSRRSGLSNFIGGK